MPREDRMIVDERRKYLNLVAPRYARAGRSERSALLTEMAAERLWQHPKPAQTPNEKEAATALR